MKVRWLLKAVNDLEDLHEYIAADNPTAASRQVELILDAAARLIENANIGRPGRVKGTSNSNFGQFRGNHGELPLQIR